LKEHTVISTETIQGDETAISEGAITDNFSSLQKINEE